jgi:hypothetical protein
MRFCLRKNGVMIYSSIQPSRFVFVVLYCLYKNIDNETTAKVAGLTGHCLLIGYDQVGSAFSCEMVLNYYLIQPSSASSSVAF